MEETMNGKLAYERFAHNHGVKIQHYRGDNMRYNKQDSLTSCESNKQKYDLCGAGGHHQNGIAEAHNKILAYGGITIFLHAKRIWLKVINATLWPYALLATAKRHKKLSLDENSDSSLEKFSGTKEEIMSIGWHTWGCPIFVLAEEYQKRVGVRVYLGYSPVHVGNVALVLNLLTGHVGPQYHVVFDDEFTTVD